MRSEEVRKRIAEIGIVPSARVKKADHAVFAAETLYTSGIPVIEITLTLPEATKVIESLAKRFPDLIVGAGTVLDEQTAQRCIDAGARFLTSPGLVVEIVGCAKRADVVVFPGALTPTEVIAAWKAGADFVKLYPAGTAGGPNYVRAIKTPLPQIPLIVTGGVNQNTTLDYLLAGATAIGIGSELLPRDAIQNHHSDRIHELARRFLQMVKEANAQRTSE